MSVRPNVFNNSQVGLCYCPCVVVMHCEMWIVEQVGQINSKLLLPVYYHWHLVIKTIWRGRWPWKRILPKMLTNMSDSWGTTQESTYYGVDRCFQMEQSNHLLTSALERNACACIFTKQSWTFGRQRKTHLH